MPVFFHFIFCCMMSLYFVMDAVTVSTLVIIFVFDFWFGVTPGDA